MEPKAGSFLIARYEASFYLSPFWPNKYMYRICILAVGIESRIGGGNADLVQRLDQSCGGWQ